MSFLRPAFRSVAAKAVARPVVATPVARAFSTSMRVASGGQPPLLTGSGVSAGEVPTDEQQATGIERFELLGKVEGIDVFDMKPLQADRLGTVESPIEVFSYFPDRHVGCTGFPADSHDTVWLALNTTLKNHRCPECGSVYTLKFEPHGSLENDHHH